MLIMFMAYKLLPFAADNYYVNFVDPAHSNQPIEVLYSTWDAQHYLYLSENGYQPGILSDIQFPLFPALIHITTPIFGGDDVVAALVVSNLSSLIGLVLLFDLFSELYDQQTAARTLILFIAFPTAFYLSLAYSEPIFLLLIAIFFRLLYRGKLGWAAIPAALLPLARTPGALVLVPYVSYYLVEVVGLGRRYFGLQGIRIPPGEPATGGQPGEGSSSVSMAEAWSRLRSPRGLFVLSPLLGVAAYFGFMYVATGNPLELVREAATNVSGFSPTLFLHPLDLYHQLMPDHLEIHGFTNSMIDRSFFAAFLLLIIPLFRKVHISLALYALATACLSVVGGSFVSYTRYVLVAFPVFIALALLLQHRRLSVLWMPLLYLFTMLQSLFLILHALNYWLA